MTDSKQSQNPVPFRTMKLMETKRETPKAILVTMAGSPRPQSECVHCGREISHPVSLHFGIGSTCIKHYPELMAGYNEKEIESTYEHLKEQMSKITWEGWLPKGHIELIPEGWDVVFEHNEKEYHVQTSDKEKVQKIYENSTVVSIKEF